MRLLLAGVSNHLASALRSPQLELERTDSAAEAIERLAQSPAPRLLVVSEMLPGAGDVLVAVEADCRLSTLVPVVLVGDRTALAVALRQCGMAVLRRRGAGGSLRKMARRPKTPCQQARERLLRALRERTASSRRQVNCSRRLIHESRRLCTLSRGRAPRSSGG